MPANVRFAGFPHFQGTVVQRRDSHNWVVWMGGVAHKIKELAARRGHLRN